MKFKDVALGLIDFDCATPFIDFKTGKHIKEGKVDFIKGDYMFASLNRLNFRATSRKDDLIGLCYLMIFMINVNRLPDFHIPESALQNQEQQLYFFQSYKRMMTLSKMCN